MSTLTGRPLVREGFDVARQCYVYVEVGTGKVVYYRLPNGRIVLPKEEKEEEVCLPCLKNMQV